MSTITEQPILGNVHSIESFGSVDGPGVRFIVFMQAFTCERLSIYLFELVIVINPLLIKVISKYRFQFNL